MNPTIKTLEVIATRDSEGFVDVWPSDADLTLVCEGYNFRKWVACDSHELASDQDKILSGKAFIGGTYCGIKKGGMQRLLITTVVQQTDTTKAIKGYI